MKKLFFILASLLILSHIAYSQLQIDWQQSFGGSDYEDAIDIVQTEDGFIVLGSTPSSDGNISYTHGEGDYWIVRTDNLGNLIWDKAYGGSSGEYLCDGFYASNNSDIYLVGVSGSTDGDITFDPYNGAGNFWVVKIGINGDIIWDRKVGTPGGLPYYQMGSPSEDGGILCASQTTRKGGDISEYYGGYDAWVIRLDSLGQTVWDFTMGTSEFEFINDIKQTTDGGYIAGMYGMPNGTDGNINCQCIDDSYDAIVYKINVFGTGDWNRCYGGSLNDGVSTILELDDGYLVAGSTQSSDGDLDGSGYHYGYNHLGNPTSDVWLFRIDLAGNLIWSKCYGGSKDDNPTDIFQTIDGDFIVFGNSNSIDFDVIGNYDNGTYPESSIWVFKVKPSGELMWQQSIGSISEEFVNGVTQLENNDYAVAGSMWWSPLGDVNCSNFVSGSKTSYWAFGLTDITVALTDIIDQKYVNIYPNPVNSILNIEIPYSFLLENTNIELINSNGITLISLHPFTVYSQLDISKQKSGLYLLKIQHENTVITKRIIIQ